MILSQFARVVFVASIGAAIVGGFWYKIGSYYYNKGWAAAIHAVVVENNKAMKDADDARKEVNDCITGGGDWDITIGECVRAGK